MAAFAKLDHITATMHGIGETTLRALTAANDYFATRAWHADLILVTVGVLLMFALFYFVSGLIIASDTGKDEATSSKRDAALARLRVQSLEDRLNAATTILSACLDERLTIGPNAAYAHFWIDAPKDGLPRAAFCVKDRNDVLVPVSGDIVSVILQILAPDTHPRDYAPLDPECVTGYPRQLDARVLSAGALTALSPDFLVHAAWRSALALHHGDVDQDTSSAASIAQAAAICGR